MISLSDIILARKLRRIGMRMPLRTIYAARKAKLPLPLACSILMQETGGGINEFGHDPTVAIGWGAVTETKYHEYLRLRDANKNERKMQGVGPCQLTWYAYQDEADKLGGCWKPEINMLVGFKTLAEKIQHEGLFKGVESYNGTGPAAEHYAHVVLNRAKSYGIQLGIRFDA